MNNIQPKPLEKVPVKKETIPTKLKEVKMNTMPNLSAAGQEQSPSLTNSKTLWGFGIAILIYAIQQILIALNIVGQDNLLVKAGIELIIAIASFFGIYGIRDALRKLKDPR